MRRRSVVLGFVIAGIACLAPARDGADAARDVAAIPVGTRAELVVYEAPSSIYCRLFRRDVLPGYQASPRARMVPIRFVDVTDGAPGLEGLAAPVTTVPTVVYLRDGREEGRITGYTGPESFFQIVSRLLGPLE